MEKSTNNCGIFEKRQKHKVFVFLLNSAPPIFQTLHRLCIYKKGRKNDKKHISKDYLLNCRCSNRIQNFCCKNLGEVILNRFSNFATFLLTVKTLIKLVYRIWILLLNFYVTKVGPQLEKVLRNNCVKLFYSKKIYIFRLKEMRKTLVHN